MSVVGRGDPTAAPRDVLIRFAAGSADLAGTLTLPAGPGPHPAFLLLPERGAVDRDGVPTPEWPEPDVPEIPVPLLPGLAATLARAGYAALRYDKRGIGASGGDWIDADLDTLLADSRSALRAIQSRPEIAPDRIGLLGHGEGAFLAARLAAEDRSVRALILLAATIRPLDRALLAAAEREAAAIADLPAAIRLSEGIPPDFDPVRVALNTIDALDRAEDPVLAIGGYRIKVEWFRQHARSDPRAAFRRVRCPALILHGTDDQQVDPAEAAEVARVLRSAGNEAVEVITIEGEDHYFAARAPQAGGIRSLEAAMTHWVPRRL